MSLCYKSCSCRPPSARSLPLKPSEMSSLVPSCPTAAIVLQWERSFCARRPLQPLLCLCRAPGAAAGCCIVQSAGGTGGTASKLGLAKTGPGTVSGVRGDDPVSQTERQVLTGGVVVDSIKLFRTRSGHQISCCAARPTGSDTVHRQVTVQTYKRTDMRTGRQCGDSFGAAPTTAKVDRVQT